MAASHAERQARYRARKADQEATLEGLVQVVRELAAEVRALRMAGGQPAQNGGKASRDVGNSHVTAGGRPRARVETAPLPPTGVVGAPSDVTEEDLAGDWWTVAKVMAGHGSNSAAGIRDALGAKGVELPLAKVAAALVYGLDRREAIRSPGDTPHRPDLWTLVARDVAMDPVAPRNVDPGPAVHVTCQDYQGHATHHAWDPAAGRFRCALCDPASQEVVTNARDHARQGAPTDRGPGGPTPGVFGAAGAPHPAG